ncbi:putative ribonuclease H-like domain-containing protein [Tanacetum coccineum]
MKPFGCHVTILNTLDYLGKFDGKSDDGFFVGYSLNSKAFRVYNIRTRRVEENLHIKFLEDKSIIAGTNSNDFVRTEKSIGAGHSSMEIGSSQYYILMPLWKDGSLFDSSSKYASNDEPQPSSNAGKKDGEGVSQESGIDDQEKPENSTQGVNTARPSINTASTNVNTVSLNINTVSPTVTTITLEATHANFISDETELDISNITTTYLVPTTLNTRIHKDHSLDHVIGDVQSGVQTRIMTKTSSEQGFISAVYEGKTHEDLHNWFEDLEFPDRFYKVEKALYCLHQAPRAWYETLSTYLLDNGFERAQFRLTFQVSKLGLWYPKDSPFDLEAYTDSAYAGASLDKKSTTGGCQFLGSRLISWQCKKQTIVANSTTEAEYIFIDNESTICIVKNPVFYSKTKHIEIRHHFIRDSKEKRLIQMIKIQTDQNVADLLIKAFDVGMF